MKLKYVNVSHTPQEEREWEKHGGGGKLFIHCRNDFRSTFTQEKWIGSEADTSDSNNICFLLQTLDPSVLVWGLYCGAVGVMFTVIKIFNFKLHHVFNTGELVEEDAKSESPESGEAVRKTPENRSQLM